MSLPDSTPHLPKWPFFLGDAALLAAAWFLARHSEAPLSSNTVAAVAACVALGAVLGVVPFLTDYARKHDAALDERQSGLEALGRTITTAAEQISIAAAGLHQITEIAHKNLKHAEQLPHKLQEKISEFNAQLDHAREDDREELEKELAELRASETERLETIANKIHKAVGELTKLDSTAQKQIGTQADLLARAGDTIAQAHADAAGALNAAATSAARTLADVQQRALAEIDARLRERTAAAVAAIEAALSHTTPSSALVSAETPAPLPESASEVGSTPKRTRKARRDETPTEETPSPVIDFPTPVSPSSEAILETLPPAETISEPSPPPPVELDQEQEPAPVPVETIAKIEPVAPASADPFPDDPPSPAQPHFAPPSTPVPSDNPPPLSAASASPVADRPVKKRSPRKNAPPPVLETPPQSDAPAEEFTLVSEDDSPVTSHDTVERVISSDGATRLIATAYIGIGNRLFIRGEGPGLSWEKGVPLQFISIGKWRWETADATAPVSFKLYKNDEIECTSLGALALDPGHQQEVTARF